MKSLIKNIGDNLSVVAIVPLILGGLWQILELASISSSYIRFFSVTQQLADGLLILFVFILLYITFLFLKNMVLKDNKINVTSFEEKSSWNIIQRMLSMVFVFAIMMIFLIDVINMLPDLMEDFLSGNINLPIIIFMLLTFGAISLPVSGFFLFSTVLIKRKTSFRVNTKSENFDLIKKILISVVIIIGLRILIEVLPIFHSAYMIPKNLTNIQYVIDKYCKANKVLNKKR